VHARALSDLVDGIARPVNGDPNQIEIGTAHSPHRSPVIPVIAGREQVRGKYRQGKAASDSARMRRGQRFLAPFEDEDRLPEHRQVLRLVRVQVRLANHFWHTLPETAHEERRHVQPLPHFQVGPQQHRDLSVESHRCQLSTVSVHSRSSHGKQSNTVTG